MRLDVTSAERYLECVDAPAADRPPRRAGARGRSGNGLTNRGLAPPDFIAMLSDMTTNTLLPSLPLGCRVYLPDGSIGHAYRERGSDRYTVAQGQRQDTGWRRDQLIEIAG